MLTLLATSYPINDVSDGSHFAGSGGFEIIIRFKCSRNVFL